MITAKQQLEKWDRQVYRNFKAGRISRNCILPEQWRRIKKLGLVE